MRPGGRAPARTATAPRCGFRSQRVQHRLVLAAGHLQGPVMTVTQLRTTPFLWWRQSTERGGRARAKARARYWRFPPAFLPKAGPARVESVEPALPPANAPGRCPGVVGPGERPGGGGNRLKGAGVGSSIILPSGNAN